MTNASSPDSLRQYYRSEIPDRIEITDHVYADHGFCEWVRSEIALNRYALHQAITLPIRLTEGWPCSSSATGIVAVYEHSIGASTLSSNGGPSLTPGSVLDCFFLYSLLVSYSKEGRALSLPHRGEQSCRLVSALDERNKSSAGTGLPHWGHKCDMCHPMVLDPLSGTECK